MKKTFFLLFLSSLFLALGQVTVLFNDLLLPPKIFAHFSWFGLLPLLFALEKSANPRREFWCSFASLFLFFSLALYWVTIAMAVFGGMPWTVSVLVFHLLVAYLALMQTIGFVGGRAISRATGMPQYLTIPSAWVAMEYARTHLLSGFPWANLADSQALGNPILLQMAAWTGENGVTWVLVFGNVFLFDFIRKKTTRPEAAAFAVLCLVVAACGFFGLRTETVQRGETLRLAAVQANVAQEEKWDRRYANRIVDDYLRLTDKAAAEGAALVIWPEASFPFLVERDGLRFPLAKPLPTDVLVGAAARRGENLSNSAFWLKPNLEIGGVSDKTHLVPFGEYVPLARLLFFVQRLVPAVGNFVPAPMPKILPFRNDLKLGVLICYEDIFPAISRQLVQGGADLLINMTNDAWYGHSSAAHQHLAISIYRAVEGRRPLIRATNTGMSAIISEKGAVLSKLPWFREDLLFWNFQIPVPGSPTWYVRFGDWFPKLCLLFFLSASLGVVVERRRTR